MRKPNRPLIVLLTGASGAGKTTVTKALEHDLDKAAVFYFDDIGIPSTETMTAQHGSPQNWQRCATHTWIERISQEKNKDVVLLEGSFYPEFALEKLQELRLDNYLIICLSAERDIRESRLKYERNQPELAHQDMENYSRVLQKKTLAAQGVVIDTSNKTVAQVVGEIKKLIQR
jgi:uridine kinase